ncbi:MAG: carboxylesterase/lipase family protein [Flavisolibacter sp.]|jgi:para-nitrobenzyl esterase
MQSNRRSFLQKLGLSAAGISIGTATPLSLLAREDRKPKDNTGEQLLFIGDDIAVTDTSNGKVRGYILRDIYTFLGIPYGADTSGANRFMPPKKPTPWTETKPVVWWGNSAPQNLERRYADPNASFLDHWNYDDVSENCLNLNVWTPSIKDNKKRPVLVWLHGGGFTAGNSHEQDGYMGENLSRFGDIVFCSVNHRLGAMGFSNFAAAAGEKFAASGNVGMLDIVAALEWVKDNITYFGGDPNNVTIMGQSGGGAKVCILTAMPTAKGLFHKGVALSGSSLRSGNKENSEKLGEYILKEAGLSASQIEQLQQMSWQQYNELATKAVRKLREESGAIGMMGGFSPVVDGVYLPQHPFFPQGSPQADNIPMILCSTFYEASPSRYDAKLENISFAEVKDKLKDRFKDKTDMVLDAYRKTFPDKKPVEIWTLITSNRQNVLALADVKSKQSAPVYVAWFGWLPPLFDNRLRSFHCSDICFWFYNTDLMLSHTGGGNRPKKLSTRMAGSLIRFMKTGNPNGGGLPNWSRYSSEQGETMVLNDTPMLQNDPDGPARKMLA